MSGKNGSLPLWKELAMTNPRSGRSRGNGRASSVPAESRKEIRSHLANVAKGWLTSENEERKTEKGDCDDEENSEENEMALPVFTRTANGGYPAAWVGAGTYGKSGDSFAGVLLCSSNLNLRKPLYVEDPEDASVTKQALVGIGPMDIVLFVRGKNPLIKRNQSIKVNACRVLDRKDAASDGEGGTKDINTRHARGIFFDLVRKHPNLAEALTDCKRDGGRLVKVPRSGIVDWFSEREGYGFINLPNEEFDDVFVHETEVNNGPLNDGDSVEFRTKTGDKGPRAVDVTKV